MPGEIAECRKNGERKDVRAQWEEEVKGSCSGQHREQRECQEQEHSQTVPPSCWETSKEKSNKWRGKSPS